MDGAAVKTRSLVASLAIHGVVLLVIAIVVRKPFALRPEPDEPPMLDIEMIEPVRQVSPPTETVVAPRPATRGPVRPPPGGRPGAGAPAPAATRDPLGELELTDEPDERGRGGTGGNDRGAGGGSGNGFGGDGIGMGTWKLGGDLGLQVPPPPPSLARGPRPKHDYSHWAFRGQSGYRGATIVVDLVIDPHGTVTHVRLVRGVVDMLDDRAIATARGFEFDPALNDRGDPITSVHRWEFVLRDDFDGFAPRYR